MDATTKYSSEWTSELTTETQKGEVSTRIIVQTRLLRHFTVWIISVVLVITTAQQTLPIHGIEFMEKWMSHM